VTETGPSTPASQERASNASKGQKADVGIAAFSVGLLLALTLGSVFLAWPAVRADWLAQHGPAMIGIPAAVLIATVVVSSARALDGEAGFAFLGAAATGSGAFVLMWLAVFAAVVLAIRTLW
jgi:hypothetical protein